MSGPASWDAVYERLGERGVSWHQPFPEASLELIAAAGGAAGRAAIDVGGGMSPLAGELVARGAARVTVLDVSAVALAGARERLGAGAAERVRWVRADVLDWTPEPGYDLWHDRAVFHFLIDPADRARYAAALRAALRPGGHAVVGTFAADGPERCSGRPVARYGPGELAAALGPGLEPVAARREEHTTPAGTVQPFTWALLRAAGA